MRQLFWTIAALLSLICFPATAHDVLRHHDDGRYYDNSGRYQGRVDANGRHYDSSGRYLGREDDNGRFYDQSGRYQGRVSR